jgi:hypothetical protein
MNFHRKFMRWVLFNVPMPDWLASHILHMSLPGSSKMRRVTNDHK